MVQGRKPDRKRRALIQRWRDAGLTQAEIGRRLGITRQAVDGTLRNIEKGQNLGRLRALGRVRPGHYLPRRPAWRPR